MERDGVYMVRLVRHCIALVRGLEEHSRDGGFGWGAGGWVTWMNMESDKAMIQVNA